jgi:TolB-like protein/Tfp pilus assembly protein PilF
LSFFAELKRRNVFRVGVAYVVVAWLIVQVLQVLLESFGTPDWVMKTVIVLMVTGLPFALIFAWAFEMTPEGLKREHEVDRSQSITSETGRKLNNAIIGILVVALGYFVYDKIVLEAAREAELVETTKQEVTEQLGALPPSADNADKSIAVLPFVNMSGDQENEYFSDGLTEELLNSLARIKELKVTGRTSSFAFKGRNTDLREIGQTLGVAHILEGSVRKAQNRLRITAQLIKAEDGYHMWSDTYDRELDDIFTIQEEIAKQVATELVSTLLGDSTEQLIHRDTNNVQAYEAYLRARYLFVRKPDDVQVQHDVEQLIQRALELDPDFTLAWYGHFSVLDFRQRNGSIDYQEGADQLRKLADKMISMDPDLPESHVAMGRVATIEMKWPEAEAAYNHALKLNPGDINALSAISGLMTLLNRNDDGLEYAEMALERDPLDVRALLNTTVVYALTGRCDDATKIATRALSLVPDAGRFRGRVGNCWLSHEGDYEKAIELFEKEPVKFMSLTGKAIAYNKLDQQDKAQQNLDELIEAYGEQASYQFAQIYAQWGETEKSLDALERAWEIRDTGFVLINMDSQLDPIRDQPRFMALLEIWQDPAKR